MGKIEKRLSSSQMIILGFAVIILLGTLLLMLPISSKRETFSPFLDCLLTSTSAVCVTGLVVYDTAVHWTLFGQAVILILIQIGGMGVITVAAALSLAAGRKISLMQRSTIQDAISAPQVGGIVRFTGFILKGIFLIELLGAVVMAPVFIRDHGFGEGLWMAVFHSISAFCNAGFDIVDDGVLFNSLMGYASDPVINLAVMLLVIVGGLGFLTWRDIYTNGIHVKRYRMQSKVILTMTAGLLLIPAVYFFFFELDHLPLAERFWGAWFQAMTPRTAGFNTVDLNAMSESGQMLTALLMLIGGAPGSTAGGMKVTTFAVMAAVAVAVFKRRQNGRFFGRRIDDETVKNAATVFLMYIGLFLLGGMIISKLEGLPLLACLYESASAVGTVGLSLGITPELGWISKLILTALMYIGRVGGLTLLFATLPATKNTMSRLPLEKISVG
ncbi:MAG: Trk family potassium uptake protein [Clostridia bacterium]|nr:Trk family potassium uptake protein [Clostridia bacterium]